MSNEKVVLITGGAGFIGHHIVEHMLRTTDWKVIIIDRLSYAGSLNRITDMSCWEKEKHRVNFVFHDLRAPISETVHGLIGDVDYVFHLAGETHVDRSLNDSILFVMSNVLGVTNLLEYVKKKQKDIEKFVYFSTDEVFGPAPEGIYYKEGDTHNPSNPYSASKSAGESMCKSFGFSFGVPIVITRTMNCIGERQDKEKFIPKAVRAILNNEKVNIHGLPGNISSRCWIHCRNVAAALLFLMEDSEIITKKHQNDPSYGVYHIVGEEKDVLYLANRVANLIRGRDLKDNEVTYEAYHFTRPGHDARYAMSGDKLLSMGFEYKLSLDRSFDKTIKWMIDPKHKLWLY